MCQLIPNECHFIAVGKWNPSIIEPSWLQKQFPTLVPKEFKIQYRAGVSISLQFKFKGIALVVANNSLTFIPEKMDDDTLCYIAALSTSIYKKLEHTPVSAVGCNFAFKLNADEELNIDKIVNPEKIDQLYKDFIPEEMTSKRVRHTLAFENHLLNIDYFFDPGNSKIFYNYNYQGDKPIENAANSLIENLKFSININNQLLKEK